MVHEPWEVQVVSVVLVRKITCVQLFANGLSQRVPRNVWWIHEVESIFPPLPIEAWRGGEGVWSLEKRIKASLHIIQARAVFHNLCPVLQMRRVPLMLS